MPTPGAELKGVTRKAGNESYVFQPEVGITQVRPGANADHTLTEILLYASSPLAPETPLRMALSGRGKSPASIPTNFTLVYFLIVDPEIMGAAGDAWQPALDGVAGKRQGLFCWQEWATSPDGTQVYIVVLTTGQKAQYVTRKLS